MNTQENYNELFEALVEAQKAFKEPKRTKKVDFTSKKTGRRIKYDWAPMDEVRRCVLEPLADHGLCIIQPPCTREKGCIGVETILAHKGGQYIARHFDVEIDTRDPQEIGSAITYFRRYCMLGILGLAPEDDDGQSAIPEKKETNPAKYKFKFGKFKNKTVDSVDMGELKSWAEWMVKSGKTDGPAKEALAAIKIFLSDKC